MTCHGSIATNTSTFTAPRLSLRSNYLPVGFPAKIDYIHLVSGEVVDMTNGVLGLQHNCLSFIHELNCLEVSMRDCTQALCCNLS